jgi:hypothetical protein
MPFKKGCIPWNTGTKGVIKHGFKKGHTINKGKHHSQEAIEKMSRSKKGRIHSGSFKKGRLISQEMREKMSMAHRGQIHSGSFKKGRIVSQEIREKLKISRAKYVLPRQNTSIEVIIQKGLDKLGIPFEQHWHMNFGKFGHQFDIFIPPNTLIDLDGCFFHACPSCFPNRDKLTPVQLANIVIDNRVNEAMLGKNYKYIRLWGHDINNNLEWCIKQIVDEKM